VLIYDGGGFQNVVGDLDADFFVLMVVWRLISHRRDKIRCHLKKVFSSDIGVEPSYQVLDILEYACVLILGLALISTENPNFEVAFSVNIGLIVENKYFYVTMPTVNNFGEYLKR